MFKSQLNVYQYLDLKYCFHFSSQSLFSIFLIAASYTFSWSIFFFPSLTMALRFMDILSMFSYLCVSFFSMFCFVFLLKFANEILLNKYQRQGLRLLLSSADKMFQVYIQFFTQSAFCKIYMSVRTTLQHIPIYVYWGKICSLLEPRYPENNYWYF